MKVHVEEISPIKKKVHVEVPEDHVAKEIDSFYDELKKKSKIKGFRPGKAPRSILERYFKDYTKGEVLQRLIQETFPKALSEISCSPVAPPAFDPQELESGKPFRYAAIVEVKPEIKIEDYAGLNLEGKREDVGDQELEERLKSLQNLHAQLKTISEPREIRTGDYVILDYDAKMDGKPLDEGKGIDVPVEVGSGRFIPTLEEKLIGLKPEDERNVDVSFPADYAYKKWAGKTVSFHVKVKEIKEKILPALDEEFAKDLGGFDSLEALKVKLREDMQKAKEMALDRHFKDQIVDQLLQKNSFEIPPSLVEDQNQALVSEAKLRLTSQGMNLKDMDISEDKLREDYRAVAERQVKTYLILEKIAGQEGISVSDEEVQGRLKEISERSHQKLEAVKRYYEKNGLIPEIQAGLLSDKTLNLLLEKSHIKYL
jgi:trigger factor